MTTIEVSCPTSEMDDGRFEPAHPDSATPSGDGGESATRGEIEGQVDRLIEAARWAGRTDALGAWSARKAEDSLGDARTALLSRITSPSSKNTSGRDPSGPGSREPGPSVPASGFDPSRSFRERRLKGSATVTWYHPDDAIPMEIVIISGGIGYLKEGRWYTLTGKDAPGMPIEWPVTAWAPMLFAPEDEHPCPNRALYDVGQCCGGHCFGVDGPENDEPAPGIETGTATTEGRGPKDESPIAESEAPASLSPTPPGLIQAARERGDAVDEIVVEVLDWMMCEGLMRHRTPEDDGLKIREIALRALQTPHQGLEDGRHPDGHGLTLRALHAANIARQAEWCPDQVPDLSFRGNELAGEVGEACNVVKKLERERHGWRGSRATLDDLAQELADVVICADLCAVTAGIDLDAAVVAKFNATSAKQGLCTMLPHPNPTTGGEAPGRDDGWVLAPQMPTPEMLEAGRKAADAKWSAYTGGRAALDGMEFFVREGYRAMLSASPRSSQKEEGV